MALFKSVRANATCGSPEEKYYSVVERDKLPRRRTLSSCDSSDQALSHNASKMVDGDISTWWQSPASVDKVSITIDLRGPHQKVRSSTKCWIVIFSVLLSFTRTDLVFNSKRRYSVLVFPQQY